MDLPPEILLKDRYRILYKLGQGGMGTVFLARDLSLEHDVAVKANQSTVDEGGNQFLREARLLAALRHPNLPRVTDYFILDKTQYLVMDYIPGDDLDTLLKRNGPQPLDRVIPWAQQLGGALSYMHHQIPPVVHRDIKPGNIKLSADGQAVLVDFGIAKAIASDQVTATALHGHTPGFAPPEQYGEGHTGPHTDQYALAATIYMLLSGQKPVDSIQRVLGQAVLTPLAILASGTPASVQAVLEKALAVKSEERYPHIDAFVSALAAAASGAPAAVSQVTQVRPSASFTNQPTVVGSQGIPPPGYPYTGQAVPTAPRTPAPRRGIALWLIAALGLGGLGFLAVVALMAYLLLRGAVPTRESASATPPIAAQVATTAAPTDVKLVVEPSLTPGVTASLAPTATETPLPPTLTPTISPSPTPVPATATLPPLGQGGLIAFVSDRADGKTLQLWTMRAWMNDQGQMVTGDLSQLTTSEGDKRQPRWSPDGTELLFVAPGGGAGELDIWKMKVDGSSPPVDISNRKGSETDPAWSPDGKQIAFTVDSRGDGVLQLYIMNADGSNPYKLSYDQDESSPAWSPKMDWLGFIMNIAGNRIFYLRAPSNPAAVTPVPPFYVTPQPFDKFDLRGNLGQVAEPVWSPDGNWIAYTSLRNNNERLHVARYPIRIVDQDIIPLATSGRNMSPAWSPDSQWIVFVSYRDGNPELYVMRSTGKNQSRLTDAPGRDLDPSWQVLK